MARAQNNTCFGWADVTKAQPWQLGSDLLCVCDLQNVCVAHRKYVGQHHPRLRNLSNGRGGGRGQREDKAEFCALQHKNHTRNTATLPLVPLFAFFQQTQTGAIRRSSFPGRAGIMAVAVAWQVSLLTYEVHVEMEDLLSTLGAVVHDHPFVFHDAAKKGRNGERAAPAGGGGGGNMQRTTQQSRRTGDGGKRREYRRSARPMESRDQHGPWKAGKHE